MKVTTGTPWLHARATHGDGARICHSRPKQQGCGWPLDPALGDVELHPWCDIARDDLTGLTRRRELAAVRLAERRRTRDAMIEGLTDGR